MTRASKSLVLAMLIAFALASSMVVAHPALAKESAHQLKLQLKDSKQRFKWVTVSGTNQNQSELTWDSRKVITPNSVNTSAVTTTNWWWVDGGRVDVAWQLTNGTKGGCQIFLDPYIYSKGTVTANINRDGTCPFSVH